MVHFYNNTNDLELLLPTCRGFRHPLINSSVAATVAGNKGGSKVGMMMV